MTIVQEILENLCEVQLRYKGMSVNILGLPVMNKYQKRSVHATVSYLKKKHFIEKELHGWILTPQGKIYLQKKQDSLKRFDMHFPKGAPRDQLVLFDIPESKKAHREWLRFELRKAGYVMMQKSVWVGPSPLPSDFISYLSKIGVKKNIQTFRLAKPYISK